ncbi:MAG: penicillin acylase family protein [Halanaeroarchaeum sp.]
MESIDRVRRGIVAAALTGTGAAVLGTDLDSYLDRFAPLSGSVWRSARSAPPDSVDGPYGEASVTYDGHGVPRIEANEERALYYAVGYLHGADRLFQLDLQRRQMRGELSAVVGDATLSSDEFHVKMDFVGAAEATWEGIADTRVGRLVSAYAEGVNAARTGKALPVEFSLLEYEPGAWTPIDTMLMQKQIAWGLTGSFRTLRIATVADAFGSDVASDLYPTRLDHDTPIVRDERGSATTEDVAAPGDYSGVVDWVRPHEPDSGVGSNSWVVSGDHTESGAPIVCNDPHLTLMAPPVWYQQHLEAADYWVRGVTFPGVPFVVIGENHAGAWGFTNVGADVLDVFQYDTRVGEYRYGDEWRSYDEAQRTVEVANGEDVTVTVRKTVHGPVLEREGERVAVAWTGLTATETTTAIYRLARSSGADDVLDAIRAFDEPTQNLVYADRDGNTLYHVTGRIPIRTVGGEEVRGNRIFDGSSGEGEWQGFSPYGTSTWEGFVPFDEKPGVWNPDVLATANQRVTDDPTHYLGQGYAPPFRGERIYERLDAAIADGPVTPGDMRDLQRDVRDGRAARLVPRLREIRPRLSERARSYLDELADWTYDMNPEDRAPTVFARWFEAYTEVLYGDAFDAAGLDSGDYPNDWITTTLGPESPWFDVDAAPDSPAAAMATAMESVAEDFGGDEPPRYGEYNRLAIDHPFDQPFLNYPRLPVGGSAATIKNYRRDAAVGSSWRMVVPMDGDASVILPGGNDGNPFSTTYADQIQRWARGDYLPFDREWSGRSVSFGGGGE